MEVPQSAVQTLTRPIEGFDQLSPMSRKPAPGVPAASASPGSVISQRIVGQDRAGWPDRTVASAESLPQVPSPPAFRHCGALKVAGMIVTGLPPASVVSASGCVMSSA